MKRKLGATIGTLAAAAVLGLGFAQSGGVQAEPNFSTADIHKKVSEQYPGTIKELELEKESNKEVYEVEIEINGKEYELEVDGNTGEILSLDEKTISPKENVVNTVSDNLIITEKKVDTDNKDGKANNRDDNSAKRENKADKSDSSNTVKKENEAAKQDDKPVQKEKVSNKQSANSSKQDNSNKNNEKVNEKKESTKRAVIGESQARSIALSQFPGKVEEIELDKDNGRLIYEVEIENGNKEAEIDIDAYTGAVLVLEFDTDDDD